MRTLGPGERAVIAGARVGHDVRVDIQHGDGTWIDYTGFLITLDWAGQLDQPVATGSMTLRRESGAGYSLAPLMESSALNVAAGGFAPALDLGRGVRILTATHAIGAAPAFREVFLGRVDTVAWDQDPVTVTFSDLGGWLMDTLIEEERPYGSEAGTAVETVIQQILDANPNGKGVPTLYTPVSPGWMIRTFKQAKTQLLEGIRALALQIGWDLRYRYDADDVARLTLLDPDRGSATVHATIGDTEYTDIRALGLSLANVRNYGTVSYLDAATGIEHRTSAWDAASMAVYGRRAFEIPASEAIDTLAEAQALIDAAVHDLSGVPVEQVVEMLYFWPVQLYDRYTFLPNGRHYDESQTLSVVGYAHSFRDGQGVTTLRCAGRVVGAFRQWHERIASGGVVVPDSAKAIQRLRPIAESADGKTRTLGWVAGPLVHRRFIYTQDVKAPILGDPFLSFQAGAPTAVLRPGQETYTVPRPQRGFYRLFAIEPRLEDLTVPDIPNAIKYHLVEPAESAMVLTGKAIIAGDKADLAIALEAGPSDFPVTVRVRADDPDGAVLTEWTLEANGTRTKDQTGALGGLQLPQREIRTFYLEAENVAGEKVARPLNADRDALPYGTVTLLHFRPAPSITIAYDDDTDAIEITLPGGKKKTWAGLSGAGTRTYTVGDAVDGDAEAEAPLTVDEQRAGYSVRLQGGGTWQTFLPATTLRGTPSNPPTLKPRVVLSANRDSASVFAVLESPVGEKLRLHVTDAEGAAAPVYSAVEGAGDTDPLWVVSGTELGPANFFHDGVGSPSAKLSGIALGRDQVKRVYLQAEGQESGIRTDRIPVVLSVKEVPYIASDALAFDPQSGELRYHLRGGAHVQSAYVEFSSSSAFASPLTDSDSLVDGEDKVFSVVLTGAQRGRNWYARAFPYNAPAMGGLQGVPVTDEVSVPSLFTYNPPVLDEVDGATTRQGRARVTVQDPGGQIDPAFKLFAWVTYKGVRTQLPGTFPGAVVSAPGGAATSGDYEFRFDLDEGHAIQLVVAARDVFGQEIVILDTVFDANSVADIVNATAAANGAGVATVTVVSDSDAAVGAGNGQYRVGGMAGEDPVGGWSGFDVTASRVSLFDVDQAPTSRRKVDVRVRNSRGEWGPERRVEIPSREPGTPVINLEQQPTPSDPDTIEFLVWANEPRSGAAVQTITLTATNCTVQLWNGASWVAFGGAQPYALGNPSSSGTAVRFRALMPDFNTAPGTIEVRAVSATGAALPQQRSIKPKDKTSFGPSLAVLATPSDTQYSIAYITDGAISYSINGAGYLVPSGSPIIIPRNGRGFGDKTVTIRAFKDGKEATAVVNVPEAPTLLSSDFSGLAGFRNGAADTLTVSWNAVNMPPGTVYDLAWEIDGGAKGTSLNITSPYDLVTPVPGVPPKGKLELMAKLNGLLLSDLKNWGEFQY